MARLSYFARLEREYRKAQRRRIRANVREYRKRKRAAGFRRIELFLNKRDYNALSALMRPDESMSAALSRLITGNRESVEKV